MLSPIISALFASVSAQNLNAAPGLGVGISSSTSFCLIIPAEAGNGADTNYIASYDASGIAACTPSVPSGAKPTKPLPTGLITSAHMISNQFYTQVTGRYDPSAYGISPADQGTQWDDSLKSQGGVLPTSGCAGFQQYLEYFGNGDFCIRCCNYAFSYYCNPSDDTRGCRAGIPGDYDTPGFTNNGAPAVTGSASSTFGSAPNPNPDIVPDWLGCAPATDTCMSAGFTCCQGQVDAAAGNGKTTCRAPGYCANPQGPNPYAGAEAGSTSSGSGSGSTSSTPSTASTKVAEWNDCTPGTSVCPNGYMCCVAPADVSSGKNTCRLAGLALGSASGCASAPSTSTTVTTVPAPSRGASKVDPSGAATCGPPNNYVCGAEAPYCSQYGYCGSTGAYSTNGQSAFNFGSASTPATSSVSSSSGSGKAQSDWENCDAKSDTCASAGFTCCVAPADVGSGKTTCRASGYCASTVAPSGGLTIPDWNDCRVSVDKCASPSFKCCVAPADVASGKSTCRAPSMCS